MSNNISYFGFLPYEGEDGAAPTFGTRWYYILYSNGTKIYRGDPVQLLSSGYIGQWTATTGVSQLAGIFWGCEYYSVSNQATIFNKYWPGADVATNAVVKAQVIPVLTGSNPKFYVQSGNSAGGATALGQSVVGQNYDVALGTGSTASGMSGAYLDQNTQGTTATLPFRLLGYYDGPGNGSDQTSANNWVIVQANIMQQTGI